MVIGTAISRRMVIAATLLALASPLMVSGAELGHDWYCPDHEGHASYVKHLKLHLEHESGAIADMLADIYGDPSLTEEQKRAKTMDVLNKYLGKEKVGPGVGD